MPKKYRLGVDDVQLEADSLGWLGNGRAVIERPEESRVGVNRALREDRASAAVGTNRQRGGGRLYSTWYDDAERQS